MQQEPERFIGVILAAFHSRGYYFVESPEGKSEFLHCRQVRERVVLKPGDLVRYSIRQCPLKPERTEAFDAVLVKRAVPNIPAPEQISVKETI